MIVVQRLDGESYEVQAMTPDKTMHRVTLDDRYYMKLTKGAVLPEELIERSFEFLLEREPASAILADFDLSVIARYFPDYEREIQRRVRV